MDPTSYPELDESPTYQLWRATNRWQRLLRRVLEPLGLTHAQYLVLGLTRFLSERHPYVTQAMVSRTGDVDEMMVSQLVRNLEAQGLLAREPHPDDARARCLRLTPEGDARIVEAKSVLRREMLAFVEPVSDRLPELTELLRALSCGGCPGDPNREPPNVRLCPSDQT
jgi:DNA-binding MarR family transcriptional regulator